MSNYRKGWLAIVCAWRNPETDLDATLAAAAKSAGQGATIIAVEDRDASGPGRNRDRGIVAAASADVIILIDAHMAFAGSVLRDMAKQVKASGGLLVPHCRNNPACDINDATTQSSGARMVYRAEDVYPAEGGGRRIERRPLVAKWARDKKPGPRTAIMGACYAFRRDWYMACGQPLAMLTGWGCDEEALSMAAWYSGHTPQLFDGIVAHRYRERSPWQKNTLENRAARDNRSRLVQTFVSEQSARRELLSWSGLLEVKPTAESERVRKAMLKTPRCWREWINCACEPEEIRGVQNEKPHPPAESMPQRAKPIQNPVALRAGITCPHCRHVHDFGLEVTHTWPNGNRRHVCAVCRNPFISMFNPARSDAVAAR